MAQDGPRQRRRAAQEAQPGLSRTAGAPKWRPKSTKIDEKIDLKIDHFFDHFSYRFFFDFRSKNGRKINQKMMKKTSRRKMLKKWKTNKNLRFLKVFWGSAGTKFAKKRSKNLWKMGLKSKSILEVIFEGFGVDFGRHFRPKNRSKNEKKLIKNKSDFKTHVTERITISGGV